MKTRFRAESDNWTQEGSKINHPAKLTEIRRVLEEEGVIIVEHSFYRGASAPERLFFEDFDEFTTWLEQHTYAGDIIEVWNWAAVCTREARLAEGKCPDEQGLVPERGAY